SLPRLLRFRRRLRARPLPGRREGRLRRVHLAAPLAAARRSGGRRRHRRGDRQGPGERRGAGGRRTPGPRGASLTRMQGNRPLVLALTLLALAGVVYVLRVSEDPDLLPPAGTPNRVVTVGGYPEFHVDGKPFFMHGAAFHYYRMPRDRWEETLRSYREHGINTIDLYVIWNWHEPEEGALDFDGHSNPR